MPLESLGSNLLLKRSNGLPNFVPGELSVMVLVKVKEHLFNRIIGLSKVETLYGLKNEQGELLEFV